MAERLIKNDCLTVEISTLGAELHSVKNKDGMEFIWQRNPDFWKNCAPVLFPICGGLKDDKFTYDGREYTLEKHGFVRFEEFEVEKALDSEIVFLLKSCERFKKSYPFDFELRVKFTLDKNTLNVTYSVTNPSDKTMYYSVGAHEAYCCPGGIENYSVELEKRENLDTYVVDGNLLEHKTVRVLENDTHFPLSYKYFDNDLLLFKHLKSSSVTLKGADRSIKLDFDDMDYFVLWTVPGAEYICLEPWCGVPDSVDSDGDIAKKEGIIALNAHETKDAVHKITFDAL